MSATIDLHPIIRNEPQARLYRYDVKSLEHWWGHLVIELGGNQIRLHQMNGEKVRKLADALYDAAELADPLPAVPADMADRLDKLKADLPTWSEEQRLALSFFMDELMGRLPTPEDFPPEDIEPCPCEQAQP